MAMTLLEAGLPPERVAVDAFDRSAAAVETARAGRYERGGTRGLDPERAARWFEHDGGALTIVPAVRALVRFEVGDLLDDDRPFARGSYDAVFCRNLLIYLTADARRRALAALRGLLAPGGVLYLGHAEVLVARGEGFAPVAGAATYACVPGSTDAVAPRTPARLPSPAPLPRRKEAPRTARSVAAPAAPSTPDAVPDFAPLVPSESDVLARARDLADAGRLAEASALLEREVTQGRPSADYFHLLALVRRATGRAREADEALGRALYLDPAHVGRAAPRGASRPRDGASARWRRASTRARGPRCRGGTSR